MKKLTRFRTALFTGLNFLCAAVYSQGIDDSSGLKLDEVTITATRFDQSSRSNAQQTVLLNMSEINWMNQPTSAELLMQSGHCFVQKSQMGGGSPALRGFEANKVLLVVDGIRMNNSIFRGGHLQNIITIDQSVMDRVEVLFGPSSVMYGSDALGGVISFTTRSLKLSDTKSAKYAASGFVRHSTAYNEKTIHASAAISTRKIASFSGITITDFGDLVQGSRYYSDYPNWGKRTFYVKRINNTDSVISNPDPEKQVQTGYAQFDFIQKLMFKTKNITHTLNAQFSTSSDVFRYDRLTETTGSGQPRSAQWYYGPQTRLLLAWHLKLPVAAFYDKSNITAAYQLVEESRHNRNFGNSNLNHRNEKLDILTLNADFLKGFQHFSLNYGAEITYNKIRSTAERENINTGEKTGLDTRYPDGGSNTQSYAVYLSGTWDLSQKLSITSGLRATRNRLYSKFIDKTFFPFPFAA